MDGADAGVEVELHAEATLIERMPAEGVERGPFMATL